MSAEPRPWPAIPFWTNAELSGVPLQPYVQLSSSAPLERMYEIYDGLLERHWMYLHRRRDEALPSSYLSRQLGFPSRVGRSFFGVPLRATPGDRAHVAGCVIAFAVMISFNHEHEVEHGPRTYVVSAAGYRFGMDGGVPVSNRNLKEWGSVPDRVANGRLCDIAWQGIPASRDPDTYDRVRAWVESRAPRLQDEEEVLLALSVLKHRRKQRDVLDGSLAAMTTEGEIRASIEFCRRHREYAFPLKEMNAELVPTHISRERFRKLFGWPQAFLPNPVDKQRAEEWDQVLHTLEQELLKGAGLCNPSLSHSSRMSST